jgi:hypothetical protein
MDMYVKVTAAKISNESSLVKEEVKIERTLVQWQNYMLQKLP